MSEVEMATTTRSGTVVLLDPVGDIEIEEGFNLRDFDDPANLAHIEGLAASIAEVGVRTPIRFRVVGNKRILTDGECRLRAARLLVERGRTDLKIPGLAEARGQNEIDRQYGLIEYNGGKNPSPLELAHWCKRVLGMGQTVPLIAKRLGKSDTYISNLLSVLEQKEEVIEAVRNGEVATTTVSNLARELKDPELVAEVLAEARADLVAEAQAEAETSGDPVPDETEIEVKIKPKDVKEASAKAKRRRDADETTGSVSGPAKSKPTYADYAKAFKEAVAAYPNVAAMHAILRKVIPN